jgi:hypothetical protein
MVMSVKVGRRLSKETQKLLKLCAENVLKWFAQARMEKELGKFVPRQKARNLLLCV